MQSGCRCPAAATPRRFPGRLHPHLLSHLLPLSSSGNHKVEEACEMYARAANMFKMAKNWSGMSPGGAGRGHRLVGGGASGASAVTGVLLRRPLLSVSLCSCRERLLSGRQTPHATAEQARLRHQLCGRWQCLQEGRSPG